MSVPQLIPVGSITSSRSFGQTTPEFVIWRWRRLANGDLVAGGQTGNIQADLKMWTYSRALTPHNDYVYEGYWAFLGVPVIRTQAKALSITEASAYEGDNEVARVPGATMLHATWQENGGTSAKWRAVLKRCSDGVTIQSNVGSAGRALPALTAGQSYLLWVHVQSETPSIPWPSDYSAVTGETDVSALTWQHPLYGPVKFSPIWRVGAYPYDDSQPDQSILLAEADEAVANGDLKKNPSWGGQLVTFNEDGTLASQDGEYSCLRIVAGGGTWIGDSNVHPDAMAGTALWKHNGSAMVPWMVDPTLRGVGDFLEDEDGVLWIGGMSAGRDGRRVALVQLTGEEYGTVTVETRNCECSSLSELATSLAKYQGMIWLTTYCELFYRDVTLPPKNRLVGTHPGGRCLKTVRTLNGDESLHFATESDFASNQKFGFAFNYLLHFIDGVKYVGPPTAHHYDSILETYAGQLWAIVHHYNELPYNVSEETAANYRQSLCYFADGDWVRTNSWRIRDGDYGKIVAAGPNLLAFGIDAKRNPVCSVLSAGHLSKHNPIDYLIWNTASGVNEAGDAGAAFLVARKRGSGDGEYLDGYYLIETGGEPESETACFTWDGVDRFVLPAAEVDSRHISAAQFAPLLSWDENVAPSGAWRDAAEPVFGVASLEFEVNGDGDFCYVLPGSATMPYAPELLAQICFSLTQGGGNGEFCILNTALAEEGLSPRDMPEFVVYNDGAWAPTSVRPTGGETYFERFLSADRVCYEFHPGNSGGGRGCTCFDPAVLTALGVTPYILSGWKAWSGTTWVNAAYTPPVTSPRMERHVGLDSLCYGPEGDLAALYIPSSRAPVSPAAALLWERAAVTAGAVGTDGSYAWTKTVSGGNLKYAPPSAEGMEGLFILKAALSTDPAPPAFLRGLGNNNWTGANSGVSYLPSLERRHGGDSDIDWLYQRATTTAEPPVSHWGETGALRALHLDALDTVPYIRTGGETWGGLPRWQSATTVPGSGDYQERVWGLARIGYRAPGLGEGIPAAVFTALGIDAEDAAPYLSWGQAAWTPGVNLPPSAAPHLVRRINEAGGVCYAAPAAFGVPREGCEDAACAYSKLPDDTRVVFCRWPEVGTDPAGPVSAFIYSDGYDPDDIASQMRLLPLVWAYEGEGPTFSLPPGTPLGEAELNILRDYTLPVPFERRLWLRNPGQRPFTLCVFKIPGHPIAPVYDVTN